MKGLEKFFACFIDRGVFDAWHKFEITFLLQTSRLLGLCSFLTDDMSYVSGLSLIT